MTLLVGHWRDAGHEVIEHRGARRAPDADLAFVHVDLTFVPPRYLEAVAHIPRVVNAAVPDISKRFVSRRLVTADDAYKGPVVVKTNLNHLGLPELLIGLRSGNPKAWLSLPLRRWAPDRWNPRPPGGNYKLYAHKAEVPAWVWRRRDLVVEQLLCEKVGEDFIVRYWHFCGDADAVAGAIGSAPLIQASSLKERLPVHSDVPPALRPLRAAFKLDYGKIDYVMSEEGPVVFDISRTPGTPLLPPSERWLSHGRLLAPGLNDLLA